MQISFTAHLEQSIRSRTHVCFERSTQTDYKHPQPQAGFFFTVGYRAVYRGNRCYRWGTVTVPSRSNRCQISILNLNSQKMKKKINKKHQKIVHDL
jgi:hypothetical protein